MGNFFAKLFGGAKWTEQKKILMLGLDAAGKTTVLYKLHLGEVLSTIPTIGFNVETLRYKNVRFNVWDVGGQDKIRSLWRYYYEGAHALIFVVDSNDQARFDAVRDELRKVLEHEEMSSVKVLVLANKQDLPKAVPPERLAQRLKPVLANHEWSVQGCSAGSGEGLYEGLDWLSNALADHRNN
jgi:small GTP-binding protein